MATLTLSECDKYYYDAEAAERPIRFAEKFLTHWEGEQAGEPYQLLSWQKEVIRNFYGWLRRDNGKRRFRTCYIEIAKGSAKSYLLSVIGIYHLLPAACGDSGGQVLSIATDFKQANLTFGTAKRFIEGSKTLSKHVNTRQFDMQTYRGNSEWLLKSGKVKGSGGFRPSCILMDELSEHPTRALYDVAQSALGKKGDSSLWIATNSGHDRQSVCFEVHAKAQRILAGSDEDDSFLPVMFCTDAEDDWQSDEIMAAANPGLGESISFESLDMLRRNAKNSAAAQANYRKLYLSQWVNDSVVWLNMDHWRKCTTALPPAEVLDKLPLFLHLDLSEDDDLTAVAKVWWDETEDRIYVAAEHWTTEWRAKEYVNQGLAYDEWKAAGEIEYIPSQRIDTEAQAKIAARIIELAKGRQAILTYDRWHSSFVVKVCEAAGVVCIPIGQGFASLSSGAKNLESRLRAKSILIAPNALLEWQASHAEIETDNKDNICPIKPNRKADYQGTRSQKIDGIVSIVSSLSEICRRSATTERSIQEEIDKWDGEIFCL